MSESPRVLLVQMPFGNLRWPNLGPSLLKAALVRQGIACDIAYLNFDFAERVGLEPYYWLADRFAFVLGGERLFARHYFGDRLPDDDRYWREVLLPADAGLVEDDRRDFEAFSAHVAPFLESCLSAVDWSRYAIVGFAASFQQTMASLCLARELKRRWPQMTIVMGGAACEGPMGVELLRQFAELDYVFLGEADESFPTVVEQLIAGGPVELPAGVAGRQSLGLPTLGQTCHDTACRMVDLDALPDPDFDDYFSRWRGSSLRDEIEPLLFFETSRGCWWGHKHHCAFCGLNGSRLVFRSKSPERAMGELTRLVDRYDVHQACSSDNNFDPRYFETLLPMMIEGHLDLAFVYEMQTTLRREQVQRMLEAGLGAAQLGIETFSTPILRLIGKATTAMQNLQVLKWFSAAGIEVKWNMLYGFPLEPAEEYAALADLIPSLVHLAPPLAVGSVRMDRFAPYFEDPAKYGLVHARPHRAFPFVYPLDERSLHELAYYFEFDFGDGRRPAEYARAMIEAVEVWQQTAGLPVLSYYDRPDGVLIITDTRPGASQFQVRMTDVERAVYLHCDPARTLPQLLEFCRRGGVGRQIDEQALVRLLAEWRDARLIACLDDRYLSLALPANANL